MSEQKVRVITPEGRLAFDRNLFEANDKGKYTASMVIDKDKDLKELLALVKDAVKEEWPKGAPKGLKMPIKEKTDPEDLEKYPYLENKMVLNASTGFEINVIDTANNALTKENIKAGDVVRFSVSTFAYSVDGNKGIGLNVNAVLKIREDEAFYKKQSAADMFGSVMTQYADEAVNSFNQSLDEADDSGFNSDDIAF